MPPTGFLILFLIIFVAVVAIAAYRQQRWIAKRMPKAARRSDPKSVAISGVAFLLMWLILSVTMSLMFGQPTRESGIAGFCLVLIIWFVAFIGAWLFGKSIAGPILLDCGAHPTKKLFLAVAVWILLVGIGILEDPGWLSKFEAIMLAIMLLCFGLHWLISAFGRLQMRENGIWGYVFLLRWNKIETYHWEREADRHTLVCKSTSIGRYLFKSTFFVPLQYKDSVDDLLKNYCAIPLGRE